MLYAAIIFTALSLCAPNPVLLGVADAGVLRHAGNYYAMGVGTAGSVYVSEDMVHWDGPIHAFSMDNAWATGPAGENSEIHACDFVLHDGKFHLYWSVNYKELRQIGHAVADTPLGPYTEQSREEALDGRIDPQCFVDHDGELYFYTVKFALGNLIFGQSMRSPYELAGEPKLLLRPVPNSWETEDHLVNEAPFVVRHRDRYYMLYNANHTAPQFGNYGIGVAEAPSPLAFTDAGKYPFPVIRSNRDSKHEGDDRNGIRREVKSAGQPSLVRGPNGFEWWLVYFADHERRSQCIDRVHFLVRSCS